MEELVNNYQLALLPQEKRYINLQKEVTEGQTKFFENIFPDEVFEETIADAE